MPILDEWRPGTAGATKSDGPLTMEVGERMHDWGEIYQNNNSWQMGRAPVPLLNSYFLRPKKQFTLKFKIYFKKYVILPYLKSINVDAKIN